MLIFRNEKSENVPDAEQMKAVLLEWQTWIKNIASSGKFAGTNRLIPEGKSIDSQYTVTDGPYAESKEYIGGYLIVKANSIEEATELARDCPNLKFGGKVEIRTIMAIASDSNASNFLEKAD